MSVIAWGGKSRYTNQSREARKVNSSKDIGNSRVDSSTSDITGNIGSVPPIRGSVPL